VKISAFNGTISFEGGTIQRNLDRAHFLQTPLGRFAKEDFVNEEWRHYKIEPEPGMIGSVHFKGDRMDRVFLLISIPSDDRNEWTEQLELERKAKHDTWLRAELGNPPYKYSWGRVDSEFDGKGCVSEIIVTYAD
jgi:hypothetical protein